MGKKTTEIVQPEMTQSLDSDPKSNKKKRVKEKEKETATIKLQTLNQQDNSLFPIVGYFPSGFDVAAGDSPPCKVRVLRHEKHHKRLQVVVSPSETSTVDFVGTSFSGEGAAPQLCTYRIGVFDKETGTLKIVSIPVNKIFRLEPTIEGSNELMAENVVDLSSFSTKRAINQKKKREAIFSKEVTNNDEDLEKKAEEIKKNLQAIESAVGLHARNIPPYDSDATAKEMAFPLDKIILPGEWDSLLDIHFKFEAEEDLSPDDYPSFVRNRVHLLGQKDEEERKKLACIFSFITHLIKFNDRHSMDGDKHAKHHSFPSIIYQRFSGMFAPSEKFRLPEEKKVLLISYALVLTLFVDDFDTDPSDIGKDLRMSDLKLRPHLEHLGCKKHTSRGSLKFELRVPLQFPKPRGKRRR